MASVLDYIVPVGAVAANAINQNRASGSATNALIDGTQAASQTISQNGTDLQKLYDEQLKQQQAALAASQGAQQSAIAGGNTTQQATIAAGNETQQKMLEPYRAAGTTDLSAIQAGLQPGGEFQPYGKSFSFTQADLQNDPGHQFTLEQGQKAIDAARRAMGSRFSGGAIKQAVDYNVGDANQYFGDAFNRGLSTFNSNENTFRNNQTDRYNRLKGIVDTGFNANTEAVNSNQNATNASVGSTQSATNASVGATGTNTAAQIQAAQNYTSQSGATKTLTNQQLADLQTQKAEAVAAGNLGKANTIQQAITAGLGVVSGIKEIDALKNIGKIASPGAALASIAGGDTAAGVAASSAATAGAANAAATSAALADAPGALGLAPGAFGAAGTSTGLTGYAGGGLVTSHGALIGMLTNPITIGVAGALLATTAILKSQAHWEANTLGKQVQAPFNQNLSKAVDGFDHAFASGQLDKNTGQQILNQTAQTIADYEDGLAKFEAKGGKDNKKVVAQARADMAKYYGPNWEGILEKMKNEVATLPATVGGAPAPATNGAQLASVAGAA